MRSSRRAAASSGVAMRCEPARRTVGPLRALALAHGAAHREPNTPRTLSHGLAGLIVPRDLTAGPEGGVGRVGAVEGREVKRPRSRGLVEADSLQSAAARGKAGNAARAARELE